MKRIFAAVILILACSSPTEPRSETHLGFLTGVDPEQPHLEIPSSVPVGEDLVVKVTTFGPNGCWEKGETEVQDTGDSVTITPSDIYHTQEGMACTDILLSFDHSVTMNFSEAGEVSVTIRGRDYPSGNLVTYHGTVVVTSPSS